MVLTWKRGVLFAVLMAALTLVGWRHVAVRSNLTAQTLASANAGGAASVSGADVLIGQHALKMIEQGRQTFRYDTFGSEAFWGDALQLHKAIAGNKDGGVGGGVSPKTALSVSLDRKSTRLNSSH